MIAIQRKVFASGSTRMRRSEVSNAKARHGRQQLKPKPVGFPRGDITGLDASFRRKVCCHRSVAPWFPMPGRPGVRLLKGLNVVTSSSTAHQRARFIVCLKSSATKLVSHKSQGSLNISFEHTIAVHRGALAAITPRLRLRKPLANLLKSIVIAGMCAHELRWRVLLLLLHACPQIHSSAGSITALRHHQQTNVVCF